MDDVKLSLYELTERFKILQEMMLDPEVDMEMINDTMESLEYPIEQKADGYAKIIRQIEGHVAMIKAEEERLAKMRGPLTSKVTMLKQSLENAMIVMDKKKFKTDLFSFNVQKNPPSVKLLVGDDAFREWAMKSNHDEYLTYVEPAINKKQIMDDLKNEKEVFGAELVQTESLRIK